MSRRAIIRASDADREHVAERLRTAATEGRLSATELEERLGSALTARTYGELDYLVADLPTASAARPPARRTTSRLLPAAVLLAVVLIAALSSAFGGHGHPDHHWGQGFHSGVWVIWFV
jgi:hypothetical protein